MDLGSAGGVDLAAAAAAAGSTGTSSRSPVWFCSNNPMHDMAEAPDAGKWQLPLPTNATAGATQLWQGCILLVTSADGHVYATETQRGCHSNCPPRNNPSASMVCKCLLVRTSTRSVAHVDQTLLPPPPAGDSSYRTLHACSSAPAGSNLFDKFDRVAQQQHRMQPDQQHLQRGHPQPSQLLHTSSQMQQQQQQHAAVAQAAPVVRARRLTARRGSWGGSEQLQR